MSVFEALILEEGANQFINGAINIIGHDGLASFLGRVREKRETRIF